MLEITGLHILSCVVFGDYETPFGNMMTAIRNSPWKNVHTMIYMQTYDKSHYKNLHLT